MSLWPIFAEVSVSSQFLMIELIVTRIAILHSLAVFPNLDELYLAQPQNITDEVLSTLTRLTKLQVLYLKSCSALHNSSLQLLADHCQLLQVLNVEVRHSTYSSSRPIRICVFFFYSFAYVWK